MSNITNLLTGLQPTLSPEMLSKGSGGVRKIRWSGTGRGKRGGARIIFYSADADYIYLMTIYAKNQMSDIGAKELKVISAHLQSMLFSLAANFYLPELRYEVE